MKRNGNGFSQSSPKSAEINRAIIKESSKWPTLCLKLCQEQSMCAFREKMHLGWLCPLPVVFRKMEENKFLS